jgi:PTH1 family peptidyl-tRNA hydrolase
VFHDELDLAPGKVRVKTGGGVAGHNGLKSMSSHLGNDYVRVRIGIGHPGRKDQVVHYVLQNFAKADHAWLEPLFGAIASEAPSLARGENDKFQSRIAYTMQTDDEPEAEVKQKPESKSARAKSAEPEPKPPQGALAGMLRRWLGSS